MGKDSNHVVMHRQVSIESTEVRGLMPLECLHCKATAYITLPSSIDALCLLTDAFTAYHRRCDSEGENPQTVGEFLALREQALAECL